jgi:hypothetical protein
MPKTVWLLNGESSHWEYKGGFFNAKGVKIPVAVSVFPGEHPKFDGYSSRCATDASSPRQAWRLRGW